MADTVKATSYEAIIRLWGENGCQSHHADRRQPPHRGSCTAEAGISEVVAEVLPQDKEKKVSELKRQGHKVAMIGDGINDAPHWQPQM